MMDVGSAAVLSPAVALRFIDDDLRKRTVVCVSRSPVEGLIAAAVTAASGGSIDEVVTEA